MLVETIHGSSPEYDNLLFSLTSPSVVMISCKIPINKLLFPHPTGPITTNSSPGFNLKLISQRTLSPNAAVSTRFFELLGSRSTFSSSFHEKFACFTWIAYFDAAGISLTILGFISKASVILLIEIRKRKQLRTDIAPTIDTNMCVMTKIVTVEKTVPASKDPSMYICMTNVTNKTNPTPPPPIILEIDIKLTFLIA